MPAASLRLTGVPGAGAWAHLCLGLLTGSQLPAPLLKGLPSLPKPLIVVLKDEEALEDLADALAALAPLFNLKAPPRAAFFGEDPAGRTAAFEHLHHGAELVLATAEALKAEAPTAREYGESRLVLRPRQGLRRAELAERLQSLGYRRVDFVECPGEYALRGAVVDFFPVEPPEPVRVLYEDDRIETLKHFDVETQAGNPNYLDEAALIPAVGLKSDMSLLGRLAKMGFWLVEEGFALGALGAPSAQVGLAAGLDLGAAAPPVFRADVAELARQCAAWSREGVKVRLFSLNRGEDERLQDLLEGRLPEGAVQFLIGPLRKGFLLPSEKLAALSSAEIFERSYRPPRRWEARHPGGGRLRWGELRKGDYVVHEAHGVARYLGLQPVSTASAPVAEPLPPQPEGRRILGRGAEPEPEAVMDCLTLEFRGGDRLFIPMTDFRQVQKFVGAEGHRPRLSSLDSKSWDEVKDRVREGVRELAGELLRLQAERAAVLGRVFEPDNRMEEEFAESFPFEETPDQRKAIEDARSDMQSGRPMDRVVVGDVGFGKTEVAMRAALKCAASGAQTAV
ncbi:MAG TPA: hypothetical protein DCM05_16475, partial [Elusimicrobia bacterium]|nr:hypothetical protein [Elusimicrobiota bacterium]